MASTTAMAESAQRKAEDMFLANDLAGARFQARKASFLCSSLPGIQNMVAAFDVLFAASTRKLPSGGTDWFAVLGVDPPCADVRAAKKRFAALCLLVHPKRNSSAAARPAFDIVMQAWDVVSSWFAPASTPAPTSSTSCLSARGASCSHPPISPRKPASAPAKAKKRKAPVGGRGDTKGRSSARTWPRLASGRYRCPHCHAEFSTWTGNGITVVMDCPECNRLVRIQPKAPVGGRGDTKGRSSARTWPSLAGGRYRCPHCHAEFSTWTGDGITVVMDCPECNRLVRIQPQQMESSSSPSKTSSRPLKKEPQIL